MAGSDKNQEEDPIDPVSQRGTIPPVPALTSQIQTVSSENPVATPKQLQELYTAVTELKLEVDESLTKIRGEVDRTSNITILGFIVMLVMVAALIISYIVQIFFTPNAAVVEKLIQQNDKLDTLIQLQQNQQTIDHEKTINIKFF